MIRILKYLKHNLYIRDLVYTNQQFNNKHTHDNVPTTLLQILKRLGELRYKKIVCLVGAGLSTASGIPDFRTPGSGIYDNLQKYNLPYPEAIFELNYFLQNPTPFYQFCKDIYPGKHMPCLAHKFLKLLEDKNILLRVYTQNIDGLELLAGLSPERVIEAHGGFSSASCSYCGQAHDIEIVKGKILSDQFPIVCEQKLCQGYVKPDIVMFGENLPSRFFTLQPEDFSECDLLLVAGTSLIVQPFGGLVHSPAEHVPRVLINRDLVYPFSYMKRDRDNDYILKADIIESIRRLMLAADWRQELLELSNDKS
ncbi:NAD-dependent protein deacetylase sirtuin-3-like [Oopsacas minuta]|uniref:NAD-dependent protein deacetylase sirtuin-3-like n=1 Tax=Oopsacas minuta TaxID=111878 RepID=A0AAV7JY36_9METZ|nr:NAD-dependent protein deacetylase sirtuin-3-like [Oopsacas minuta]